MPILSHGGQLHFENQNSLGANPGRAGRVEGAKGRLDMPELQERRGSDVCLEIIPMTLDEANEFVRTHHRHNQPVPGCKFCIGCSDGGKVVGVAIVGRPVSRHQDNGWTLEVNRTCTDGTKNANSMLYGAAWRATKALGYRRLITYTMNQESGSSLRAVGWKLIGEIKAQEWHRESRPRVTKHTIGQRLLWEAI